MTFTVLIERKKNISKKDTVLCNNEILFLNNNVDLLSLIANAKNDYILIIRGKIRLDSSANQEISNCVSKKEYDLIYGDEAVYSRLLKIKYCFFYKPDWSPDTYESFDYLGSLIVINKNTVINKKNYINFKNLSSLIFSYIKCIDFNKIFHISNLLFFNYRPIKYNYNVNNYYNLNNVYEISKSVRIIIPSKNNYDSLIRCINSIYKNTNYKNYYITIVDNGSDIDIKNKIFNFAIQHNIKYIYKTMPFNFSKMCNIGANAAKEDFLLFLNDDVELIESNWLNKMLYYGIKPHVGAVGLKFLYGDKKHIQHAGVGNKLGYPYHLFYKKNNRKKYFFNFNNIDFNCIAVTGACLLIEKIKFDKVNNFDENLFVNYNDVDLCFKLIDNNFFNVVCNSSKAIHFESQSRGYDFENKIKLERNQKELEILYYKNKNYKYFDPFLRSDLNLLNEVYFNNLFIILFYKSIKKIKKYILFICSFLKIKKYK